MSGMPTAQLDLKYDEVAIGYVNHSLAFTVGWRTGMPQMDEYWPAQSSGHYLKITNTGGHTTCPRQVH